MINFWENFIINTAFGLIHQLVKNPTHAAALKSKLLEVRDAINATYPGE